MTKKITEALPPGQVNAEGKRFLVTLITPGTGSSGIYPASTLELAAKEKVFHKGLHMYLNHQTEAEYQERPEGDINDLAAVLEEDARWVDGELKAYATPFTAFRADLAEKQNDIGVSIRAMADFEPGKPGELPTITRITEALSVDFVTHAGRGGYFRIEESRKRALDNATERVGESTANQQRDAIYQALRDQYNGEKRYAWLRDYDEANVWFEYESPDQSGLFQIAYAIDGEDAVTFSGDPIEVRTQITYVPVDPAGQSNPEESKEDPMPEISEAEVTALRESAARADTAEAERTALHTQLAEANARNAAGPVIDRLLAESDIPAVSHSAVRNGCFAQPVPLRENALDEAAFIAVVESRIDEKRSELAALAEAAGVGTIEGFGPGKPDTKVISEADYDAKSAEFFNRPKGA